MSSSFALSAKPWAVAGHAIAHTLAVQNCGQAPARLDTIIHWYENYAGQALPTHLRDQLKFAQTRPDIFEPLLRDDIFPLDADQLGPNMRTVVDCAREKIEAYEEGSWNDGSPKPEIVILQMGYTLNWGNGSVGIRTLKNFRELVAQHRPDLLPFIRPDTTAQKRLAARWEKQSWLNNLKRKARQNCSPPTNRFASPGIITNAKPPDLSLPVHPPLYRLGWLQFDSVERVIDHMLLGLERCSRSFHDHSLSLHRLAREAHTTLLKHWITDVSTEGGSPNKLYVGASRTQLPTFSGHPSENRGLHRSSFVRWHIETTRAFPITDNPHSPYPEGEAEWGIPVLINPAEFTAAEWFSETGRVFLDLRWSNDKRRVEVEISDRRSPAYSLTYDYVSPSVGFHASPQPCPV